MKKTIFAFVFIGLLGVVQWVGAVPARPGKFTKIQPDGTAIVLQMHGDEFYHWTTDENGQVVRQNSQGFYVPSQKPAGEFLGGRARARKSAAAIRAKRAAAPAAPLAAGEVNTYRFPVILVSFSDLEFSVENPQQAFSAMLNQQGYSENGGTGSVHDYYWENSMETFYAEFDVFGPVQLTGDYASYGANDDNAATALYEACVALDPQVDFSPYDNDGDGMVDMIFMYYAGHNEAEGGGENTIWPHKYELSAVSSSFSLHNFDGKKMDTYACTSELKGSDGTDMCGIGTAAHEFSHTQGLPDFYDVNYDNYAGDSACGGTYSFDIMCSGSYNNEGRTPPYFSAEERILMGWLSGYETLPSSGEITIPSIAANTAYKMETSNSGEYFVFECRPGTGWDAYVQPGMVVYHVDKSTKYRITYYYGNTDSPRTLSLTPAQAWGTYYDYNVINADGSHPCFYVIPAVDQSNLDYGWNRNIPFPGAKDVHTYTPVDWAGNSYSFLYDIAFQEGTECVTMNRGSQFSGICGTVRNSAGDPIEGATVTVYRQTKPVAATRELTPQLRISGRNPELEMFSVTTDENGYYSIVLSEVTETALDIEVVAYRYITQYEAFPVSGEFVGKNFTMRGIAEPVDYSLRKFDLSDGGLYIWGYGETATTLVGLGYTAEELRPYVGRKVLEIGFAYNLGENASVSSVSAIVDFGKTRKLTHTVSSPKAGEWNRVDVSDQNITIPENTDCYFGYALNNCSYGYPVLYSGNKPQEGAFYYGLYAANNTDWRTSSTWYENAEYGNPLIFVILEDSSEVDYNYISNPEYGYYRSGDTLPLVLVEAAGSRKPAGDISWYFDDEPISAESVVLTSGHHVIEARFTTQDGLRKVVELEIDVQ